MAKLLRKSYTAQQKFTNGFVQVLLLVLGIIWILPLCWVILTSFRAEPGSYTSYFWPKGFTLDNFTRLIFEDQQFKFTKWFVNTFIVAVVFSCVWGRLWQTGVTVSALIWSVCVVLNAFLPLPNSWLVYLIGAALQVLVVLWFVLLVVLKKSKKLNDKTFG